MKILFIGDSGVSEVLAHDLKKFHGAEVTTRPTLKPEKGLERVDVAVLPVSAWTGYGPAGVPLVLLGTIAELTPFRDRPGVAYLVETPTRAEDVWRVLKNVLEGAEELPLRERAESAFASHGLTPRESEAARLLLEGLRTQEISDLWGISTKTVKNTITSVFKKFDVESRQQLLAKIFPL